MKLRYLCKVHYFKTGREIHYRMEEEKLNSGSISLMKLICHFLNCTVSMPDYVITFAWCVYSESCIFHNMGSKYILYYILPILCMRITSGVATACGLGTQRGLGKDSDAQKIFISWKRYITYPLCDALYLFWFIPATEFEYITKRTIHFLRSSAYNESMSYLQIATYYDTTLRRKMNGYFTTFHNWFNHVFARRLFYSNACCTIKSHIFIVLVAITIHSDEILH